MIYTKDKLEELADAVNRKYFPERLSSAIALDPYDLVDKLGCTVDWKYISPDDTILGATFFSDCVWPVCRMVRSKRVICVPLTSSKPVQ